MIIGCGGGFRHETPQKYSPILEWMTKVQLCLHDEAQQFGNLDKGHQLKALLEDVDSNPHESEHMTAVMQLWCEIFGNELVWLDTVVCATCFAILWLALKGEGVPSPIATTLDAAAGLAQRQKRGLILPSSARVSKLTYQTVIGVRYPELVRPTANGWQYGRYVSAEATLRFLYFGMCQKVLCTLSVMLVR